MILSFWKKKIIKIHLLFWLVMLLLQLLNLLMAWLIVTPFILLQWFAQILAHLILLLLNNMISRGIFQHRSNLQDKSKVIIFSDPCKKCQRKLFNEKINGIWWFFYLLLSTLRRRLSFLHVAFSHFIKFINYLQLIKVFFLLIKWENEFF